MNILEKYLMEIQNVNISNVKGGVIIKEVGKIGKQLLLIQRAHTDKYPDVWEFPRGHCLVNEQETSQCLKREIKEETSLDVDVVKYIDSFKYLNQKQRTLVIQENYLCKLKDVNQQIKLSHEHQSHKWISSMGEAELLLPSELKKTVSRIFNIDSALTIYPKPVKPEVIGE